MRQMKHNNYQQNAHQQDYGLVKFDRLSKSSENNCKQEKNNFPLLSLVSNTLLESLLPTFQ